jgi:hypothetical protein
MINMQPAIFIPNMILTANGVQDFGCCPSNIIHYKIDGVFGGASVEVGYLSENNTFVRYADVPVATGNMQVAGLRLGYWSSIALRVTGATATTVVRAHFYPDTSNTIA